ncbi:hypothetical protein EDD18DRAFT_1117358 [Armillaria luteobubalina]|uniref:Uncharacterized protein n=1 Tax=Armillaria luteobubalina TaxID=153913 RepID=A0AA39UCD1_9AGAR|nr:hypothetical protein EDD18DRAFT_1117358 [Armillaria luteobubalina]
MVAGEDLVPQKRKGDETRLPAGNMERQVRRSGTVRGTTADDTILPALSAESNNEGESPYNNSYGIHYKVKLIAKFPALWAGAKQCSNAACKQVNGIFHHDERTLDFKVIGGELHVKNFMVTWTIPCSSDKDMLLDSVDAFENMVQHVEKRGKPEVALELVEDDDEDEDGDSSDDPEDISRLKKKNTSKSTPECIVHKLAIEDEIVNLQTVKKVAEVDTNHAPDTRMFQLGHTAADDALLQCQKANSAVTSTPPTTPPMNFIFPNFADLLGAQAQHLSLPLEPSQKVNFALKIDLTTFCACYSLSKDIELKLSMYQLGDIQDVT